MEPEETIYCYKKEEKCCSSRKCLGIVAIILLTALSFVIGLLVGAALAIVVLVSLPAIIVLAIILGLLLILDIILMVCNKKKKDKKCKCCY